MARRAAGAALALLLAGACGDDADPNDGQTGSGGGSGSGLFGPDVPLEDLPEALSAAVCAKLFDCCHLPVGGAGGGESYTEAQCQAEMAADLALVEAWVQGGIEAGTIEYDGGIARTCIAAIEAAACDTLGGDDFIETDDDCAGMFQGQVDLGGACELGAECRSGHCALDLVEGTGACFEPPALGQSCSGSCADGGFCEAEVCVPAKLDGATCSSDTECASGDCDLQGSDGVCVQGDLCDF